MTVSLRLAVLVALVLSACGSDGSEVPSPPRDTSSPTAAESPSPTSVPTATSSETIPPDAAESVPSPIPDGALTVEQVAEVDGPPVSAQPHPAGGLWVTTQDGFVRHVADDGTVTTVADLTDRVTFGGERGLLDLALHPAFEDNARVFLHYSGEDGQTTLVEMLGDPSDPAALDVASEQVLLTVPQPAGNHNGGQLRFDPRGMLMLALGDGGAANDRFDNGQDTSTLLGTLLRLDVSGDRGDYSIPPDNPFADGDGGAPEIWAYGLRNPWRFSFDEDRLIIADVGQNEIEEINVALADRPGLNYGWPILEGSTCFQEDECDRSGLVLPALEYTHGGTGGCSVTGGHVYRGSAIPALVGHYVFGDYCLGGFWTAALGRDGTLAEAVRWTSDTPGPISFGLDADGEILILAGESLWRIVPSR